MDINLVIAIFATLFISISTWVIINTTKKRALLALIIPMMVVIGGYSYVAVDDALGYPVAMEMPKEALYIAHKVGPNKERIYVWSTDLIAEESKPRAYSIVYTKEDEEKLEGAKEKQDAGIPQLIKKETEKLDDTASETTLNTMKIHDFDMSSVIKKGS
tara:strand:- start:116 stop:592 length:477 start_codon:yes stop_codon:yes gene_type:complete